MTFRCLARFSPLLFAAVIPAAAAAQAVPDAPMAVAPATLDATIRQDIVARLCDALRRRYVFPDVGERAGSGDRRRVSSRGL